MASLVKLFGAAAGPAAAVQRRHAAGALRPPRVAVVPRAGLAQQPVASDAYTRLKDVEVR
jgi:hypothetical protein